MDLFSKAAGCAVVKSRAKLHWWVRDWGCTTLYQQGCILLFIPNHILLAPCPWCQSFPSNLLRFWITNSALGPSNGSSMAQPMCLQRSSLGFTSHLGISNSCTVHGFPALWSSLGSSLAFITECKGSTSLHLKLGVSLTSYPTLFWTQSTFERSFSNPNQREANFQKKWSLDLLWGDIQKTWASLQHLSSPNKTGL